MANLPREFPIRARPNQLYAFEAVSSIEPTVPSEMVFELSLRHGQKSCFEIYEYVLNRFSNGECPTHFEFSIYVPKSVMNDLVVQRERYDLRKIEVQPKASRIAETRT